MSLRSISILPFVLFLSVPVPVTAAQVIIVSPTNRHTITSHQPQQSFLSQKAQQLKAYQDAEEELIKSHTPEPAPSLTKEEVEALVEKKMGKKPKSASTGNPSEKPEDRGFGTIGGIGAVGGIGQAGNVDSTGINAAE